MMKKLLFILFAMMSAATMFAAEDTAGVEATAPTDLTPKKFVWRSGKHFYQGDQELTKHEYISLLKTISLEAFRQYQKGKRLITAGWSVFGVGAGIALGLGGGLVVGQVIHDAKHPSEHPSAPMGFVFGTLLAMPIGGLIMLTSVPMLCVGYSNRNRTVATYNMALNQEPPITYNITAGQNGIGLAINF